MENTNFDTSIFGTSRSFTEWLHDTTNPLVYCLLTVDGKEFLRKNGIEEKTEEEHLNAETQEEEDSKLVYEIEQNEWRLLSSDFESRGEFLVLIEQDIYDFGIDTQKFPRADSFLNRLLGVEGRNLPRS